MTTSADLVSDFARRFGLTLTSEGQAALPPAMRDLHRAVLQAFLDTGAAPSVAWLRDQAMQVGVDPGDALARLAEDDLVHTRDVAVSVAYPFSGTPTDDQVQLDDGPSVWAMCAVDALGIPLMTGRDGVITSTDPQSGHPIHIERRKGQWLWQPTTTVVLVAATPGCVTAGEGACPYIRFYANAQNAEAHLRATPGVTGELVDQTTALEAADIVFGPLLGRISQGGIQSVRPRFDELLETAVGRLSPDTRRAYAKLGLPIFRSLADGQAPSEEELGNATSLPADEVRNLLAEIGGVERDENGRIIGWGLTRIPTPHRVEIDGRVLYGWCAPDVLALPALLGRSAKVTSPDLATGQPITLTVDPDGVRDLEPSTAVASFVATPEAADLGAMVRHNVCNNQHLFASAAAGAEWLEHHPGFTLLPVDEAFRVSLQAFQRLFEPGDDKEIGATSTPASSSGSPGRFRR